MSLVAEITKLGLKNRVCMAKGSLAPHRCPFMAPNAAIRTDVLFGEASLRRGVICCMAGLGRSRRPPEGRMSRHSLQVRTLHARQSEADIAATMSPGFRLHHHWFEKRP